MAMFDDVTIQRLDEKIAACPTPRETKATDEVAARLLLRLQLTLARAAVGRLQAGEAASVVVFHLCHRWSALVAEILGVSDSSRTKALVSLSEIALRNVAASQGGSPLPETKAPAGTRSVRTTK